MVVTNAVAPTFQPQTRRTGGSIGFPSSLYSDWQVANADATAHNNGGSAVIAPLSIGSTAIKPVDMRAGGTGFDLAMEYNPSDAPTTVVVQCFGVDANGRVKPLYDEDGNHAITLTVAATDPTYTVGGVSLAMTVCAYVDARFCAWVYVVVKTAASKAAVIIVQVG